MINSNYKFAAFFCLSLAIFAPAVWAEDPAADQTQVEQADTPAAAPDKTVQPAPDKTTAPSDAAAAQPTAPASTDADDIATKTKKAIERATAPGADKIAAAAPREKPQKLPLGSITMRQPTPRLDQIALWRDDGDIATPADVWDGTQAADVTAILPALVMAKNSHVKQIIFRIAMSAAYTPAGMTDIEYVRWRGDVLIAQKHFDLAARLLSTARLGRDSIADAQRRTAYELAAGEVEAACVESMASGGNPQQPFWQGMAALCAQHLGDAAAVKTLAAALPDGAMKTAATAHDMQGLTDAVVAASGEMPVAKIIPDNTEILAKLTQLFSDIDGADDAKAAAKESRGQLLLLALGALRAEKHGDDTGAVTDKALALAGF